MPSRNGILLAAAVSLLIGTTAALSRSAEKPPTDAERIRALTEDEREWLTVYVAPIILPEEKKVFLELAAPYQREEFQEDFWQRRERDGLPAPLGPGYRHRYRELRRIADESYDGWRSDAGRMVIRLGEPSEKLRPLDCGETFRDLEIWTYDEAGTTARTRTRYMFYRIATGFPLRLWTAQTRNEDVFVRDSCRKNFDQIALDCAAPRRGDLCWCGARCAVYEAYAEILARQGRGAGGVIEEVLSLRPYPVSTEGLERLKEKWATTSNPNAKPIHAEGPPAEAEDGGVPKGQRRMLSLDEMRDRLVRLEKKDREWLELAGPLLTLEDLSSFLQSSRGERDELARRFFKRRS